MDSRNECVGSQRLGVEILHANCTQTTPILHRYRTGTAPDQSKAPCLLREFEKWQHSTRRSRLRFNYTFRAISIFLSSNLHLEFLYIHEFQRDKKSRVVVWSAAVPIELNKKNRLIGLS